METKEMTLNEIRERGYAALLRELGPVGYVRFIQQFRTGRGDYTRDRHQWLDTLTREQIDALIEQRRRQRRADPTAGTV